MRILGHQFVMGRTIEEALERADGSRERAYRYSFDMLGESALTAQDAEQYFEKYRAAIIAVGRDAPGGPGHHGSSQHLGEAVGACIRGTSWRSGIE